MTKPYPWFYAVNDRPVVLVATPSGGTDCMVFDFVSGNLIPDRSYMSEVAPGSGRDPGGAADAPSVDAAQALARSRSALAAALRGKHGRE